MVNINHKKQENDRLNGKCGQVCLEMIYDYFGVKYDANEIWNNIKTKKSPNSLEMYALTYKLAQDAINRGLQATIYKGNDAHILENLDKLQVPAILSIRQKSSGQSHYVVFKGIKNYKYCFCDPAVTKEQVSMNYIDLRDVWSPNPNINVTGFIFIAFNTEIQKTLQCTHCGKAIPITHAELLDQVKGVVCPYCDTLL